MPLHVCGVIFGDRCGCREVDHGEDGAEFGVEKSPLRLLLLTRGLKISVGVGVGTSH